VRIWQSCCRARASPGNANLPIVTRGPVAQRRRVPVLRREIPQVVGQRPHRARKPQPGAPRRLLSLLRAGDPRVCGRQLLEQPAITELVRPHEREVDLVPTRRQLLDRRGEIPESPGVAHREQDPHPRSSVTVTRGSPACSILSKASWARPAFGGGRYPRAASIAGIVGAMSLRRKTAFMRSVATSR